MCTLARSGFWVCLGELSSRAFSWFYNFQIRSCKENTNSGTLPCYEQTCGPSEQLYFRQCICSLAKSMDNWCLHEAYKCALSCSNSYQNSCYNVHTYSPFYFHEQQQCVQTSVFCEQRTSHKFGMGTAWLVDELGCNQGGGGLKFPYVFWPPLYRRIKKEN